jgi:hypothetical protein
MFTPPIDPHKRVDPTDPLSYLELLRDRLPYLRRLYGFSESSQYAYLSQLKADLTTIAEGQQLNVQKTRPWALLGMILEPIEVPPWWPTKGGKPVIGFAPINKRAWSDYTRRRQAISFGSTTKLHPSIVPIIKSVQEDNEGLTLDALVNLQWVDPNVKQPVLSYDGVFDKKPIALLTQSQADRMIQYFYPYRCVVPGDWLLPSKFNGRQPLEVSHLRSAFRLR